MWGKKKQIKKKKKLKIKTSILQREQMTQKSSIFASEN